MSEQSTTTRKGDAVYCGNRLICIWFDRREGDDGRTMHSVPVEVTVKHVQPPQEEQAI